MALDRVDHRQIPGPEAGQQFLQTGNDRLQPQDIVAQCVAKSAQLHKISLHVNDDQRNIAELWQLVFVGLG